jgi:hypothetical protein
MIRTRGQSPAPVEKRTKLDLSTCAPRLSPPSSMKPGTRSESEDNEDSGDSYADSAQEDNSDADSESGLGSDFDDENPDQDDVTKIWNRIQDVHLDRVRRAVMEREDQDAQFVSERNCANGCLSPADTRCICLGCLDGDDATELCTQCYLGKQSLCENCAEHRVFCVHCGKVSAAVPYGVCTVFGGCICNDCLEKNRELLKDLSMPHKGDDECVSCVLYHAKGANKDPFVLYKDTGFIRSNDPEPDFDAEDQDQDNGASDA